MEPGAERQGEIRQGRKRREEDECSESEDRKRKRRKRHRRRKRSRSPSSSSSSDSNDESESSSEDERHARRKHRKSEERDKRRLKEKRRKQKRKEEKKRRKKEKGKMGPVTSSWGKYGLIKEVDMWNKRPEFSAWLAEVKKVNLETMPNWEERQMFKEYMEDYNTATLPSKKYYDIDKYHRRKMVKQMKKGVRASSDVERTEFNDEEQRRQEVRILREREKEAHIQHLKDSMRSGMAQAMREQAQLREEMQIQYRLGNLEAANAIQKRLEPDPL